MNPLLSLGLETPFDKIEAGHVRPAIDQLLASSQKAIDTIAAAAPSYPSTILSLDRATEPLDRAMSVIRHLEAVATTPELRAEFNAIEPIVSEFYSSIPLNETLWSAVRRVTTTPGGVHARFLKKTVDGFRRSGAELGPDEKKRLTEINVELAKTSTKYAENVLDSTNDWEHYIDDEAGLAGLPPSAIAAARQGAESKGKPGWRFTLQAPSYIAVMTYLDDANVREKFYRAYNRRATEEKRNNAPLVVEILNLRRERARLLGFANFADLVLEDRMAKTGARALEFAGDLEAKSRVQFERETAELERYAAEKSGRTIAPLAPWDVGYWAEKMRQDLYDFDEEALRPYFPLDRVVAGMFRIFERLYGMEIRERQAPGWDASVRCFDLWRGDRLAGIFYSDWFPRDNKRGGAWMDCLHTGGPEGSGFDPHIGLICGNLTPPVGDNPALLTHREVETIFHEFGHLLHQLLSTVEIRSLAGTHVAWDFVELPSQIMENWCWEREALDEFARHYETNEPIPQDLYERMKRARNFRAASAQMRQLSFAIMDLKLHTEYDASRDGDVVAYGREIMQSFSAARLPDDHAMVASFTHLFADAVGYGAGYYSYKWAEVLDADAFSRFREEGIFNPEVGKAFRDEILAKGNADEPEALYRAFMGRDPDVGALLARQGLA